MKSSKVFFSSSVASVLFLLWALVGCGGDENAAPAAPGAAAAPAAPPPKAAPSVGGAMFNVSANPNFGERTIAGTVAPDPLTIQVTSGGNLDISTANIPGNCRGWATAQPDANVRLATALPFLRIFMAGQGDTTLLINKPDGSWVCADDTYSTNPGIDITSAAPGLYNIWVGSYTQGTQTSGALTITASNTRTPDGEVLPLNGNAAPSAGAQNLAAQFAPATVSVTAGGNIEARTSAAGALCRGYVTPAPSLNFTLAAAESGVTVSVSDAENNADTTMVLQLPDGSYQCDDDTNDNRPALTLASASPGTYHVWIGTYTTGSPTRSTVEITRAGGSGGGSRRGGGGK